MVEAKQVAVELIDLSKEFIIEKNSVKALSSINLKVRAGDQLSLTGRSGAGKSTLPHLIGTLDRPTHGKILLNGTEVSQMNDKNLSLFRNKNIGFVFQSNNLLPEFTAEENVMLPGLISGANHSQVKSRAQKLLAAVGLEQRYRHKPSELSGGEQQRVAVARALVMAPSILLCDEPTGNLDRNTSKQVQDLILSLCQELNLTLILVTHDQELAQRLPQKVVLEDGKIITNTLH